MAAKKKTLSELEHVHPSIVLQQARGLTDVVVIGRDGKGDLYVAGSGGVAKSEALAQAGVDWLKARVGI